MIRTLSSSVMSKEHIYPKTTIFPNKRIRLLNKIKFVHRKIKQDTLEEWKLKMSLEIVDVRDMNEYTEGEGVGR